MSEEIIISYSSDILVKVRHNQEIAVTLTSQGPQGPQGEKGDTGTVTVELQALYDNTIVARDAANAAKESAFISSETATYSATSAAASAANANGNANAAAASATQAKAAETGSKTHETGAKAAEAAAVAANTGAHNSKTAAEAAQGASEAARVDAQKAKTAAEVAKGQAETARNAAQSANTDATASAGLAEAARDAANQFAASAAQSALDAAKFDPASYPTKRNNGSDFDDPAQVRINIGAAEALETISQAEAEAGVGSTARNWTSQRARQAVAAYAPAKIHTHIISDITGLQALLDTKASLTSPAFTGTPTAPTASLDNNSLQIANTAFVKQAIDALVSGAPGALDTLQELATALGDDPNFATTMTNALAEKSALGHTHTMAEITDLAAAIAALAPKASPALTGNPTATTQVTTDNSTKIATTAHVKAVIAAAGLVGSDHKHVIADVTGLEAALENKSSTGHKHVTADITDLTDLLATKADLISPVFTGNPTAATQAVGNNSTRLATTAFVVTAVANGVSGKADSGHSHIISDITGLQAALDVKATLASPTFSGTPKAPTAAAGNNTTQIATTAFVTAALSTFGTNLQINSVGGLQTALDAKLNKTDAASTYENRIAGWEYNNTGLATDAARFPWVDVSGGKFRASWNDIKNNLQASFDTRYAAASHVHGITDVTNLQTTLNTKAPLASPTFTGTLNAATIVASGNITAYSDIRLKTDIETISGALAMVTRMRGVRFTMNDKRDLGVIAQEVRKVAPEIVHEADDENKTLSVSYGNIVGILIEAIKELKEDVEELKGAA